MTVFQINRSAIEDRFDSPYYKDKPDFSRFIKLSKVAVVKGGKRIPLGMSYTTEQTNYLYLRVADMLDGDVDYSALNHIGNDVFEILKSYEISKNDIALSIAGTIGKVVYLKSIPQNNKIILTENCAKIQIKDTSVLPQYLALLLNLNITQKQIELNYIQTTIPKLGLDRIKNLYLPPIPPLPVQQTIVDLYTDAQNQRKRKLEESQKLLASIDDYLLSELGIDLPQKDNSLSKRIFTTKFSEVDDGRFDPLYQLNSSYLKSKSYKQVKLSEICCSFISGFGAGKENQSSEINGVIQIRPTNIDSDCELKFDKNVYIDKNYVAKKIKRNDVLFNNTNSQELVGKTAMGEFAENMFFSNHITVISVCESEVCPYFLKENLNMLQRHKVFYSICTNWNNQSGIGIDLLKNIKISLPPLNKQKEIADHIKSIRKQAKQLQNDAEEILQNAKKQIEKMILG